MNNQQSTNLFEHFHQHRISLFRSERYNYVHVLHFISCYKTWNTYSSSHFKRKIINRLQWYFSVIILWHWTLTACFCSCWYLTLKHDIDMIVIHDIVIGYIWWNQHASKETTWYLYQIIPNSTNNLMKFISDKIKV